MTSLITKFIHGIDLSDNVSANGGNRGQFPTNCLRLPSIRWLRLNRLDLKEIPFEIRSLKLLEVVHLSGNKLKSMKNRLVDMSSLHTLILSYNELHPDSFSADFKLPNLTVLDLSYNMLDSVPTALSKLSSLTVLNLSHNRVKSVPPDLFFTLQRILYLDLSWNEMETIPPQIRRLVKLQSLCLNNNPLNLCQLRQITSLRNLKYLNLCKTGRIETHFQALFKCCLIKRLDLSKNVFSTLPPSISSMNELTVLNISDCQMSNLSSESLGVLVNLKSLNVSRNKLRFLPPSIVTLKNLERIYIDSNQLTFDGIPAGFANLTRLKILSLCNNLIEALPEEICRCKQLRILRIASNRLVMLPDALYDLNLRQLDVFDNKNLVLKERRKEDLMRNKSKNSLSLAEDRRKMLNGNINRLRHSISASSVNGACSRYDDFDNSNYYANNRYDHSEIGSFKRLKNGKLKRRSVYATSSKTTENLVNDEKAKSSLYQAPKLDFSEFFGDDVGRFPGVTCWELDNLSPSKLDPGFYGTFHSGDCYIILKSCYDSQQLLQHEIHFWIGNSTSLDKRACAAMHAVNLRLVLGCTCRTNRQEQYSETSSFKNIFKNELNYVDGCHAESGFRVVYQDGTSHNYDEHILETMPPRALILSGSKVLDIKYAPVELASLHSNSITLIDTNKQIFLWNGAMCNSVVKSKARLFAETINLYDRQNMASVLQVDQGSESKYLLSLLSSTKHMNASASSSENQYNGTFWIGKTAPLIYKISFERGGVYLPQVIRRSKCIRREILNTTNVYICDCSGEMYIWIGKCSAKIARAVSLQLASELMKMFSRPKYFRISDVRENCEPVLFKCFFSNWLAESRAAIHKLKASNCSKNRFSSPKNRAQQAKINTVEKQGAEIINMSAIAVPRSEPMSHKEAAFLMSFFNDELASNDRMDAFVFDGRKFAKLPDEKYGIFNCKDSYIFLARYWKQCGIIDSGVMGGEGIVDGREQKEVTPRESSVISDEDEKSNIDINSETTDNNNNAGTEQVVYFWQGREASNTAWFFFNFQLKKKFEETLASNLRVIKFDQQRENIKFLAHFEQKIVIYRGSSFNNRVEDEVRNVHLFEIRWAYSPICTRCIELDVSESIRIFSCFCYIFELENVTYLWIGCKVNSDDIRIADQYANLIAKERKIVRLSESDKFPSDICPQLFTNINVDTNCDFAHYSRLFKCSNEKGCFAISEKWSDFCQDDLERDDVMILDDGDNVTVWVGDQASEIELKYAFKAAQNYCQQLAAATSSLNTNGEVKKKKRKLNFCAMNKENDNFTRCFHGWTKNRAKKQP